MPQVYREHDEELDQGDLLAEVPFHRRFSAEPPELLTNLGVVTSNGCQCERFTAKRPTDDEILNTYPLHVAPVYEAAAFDRGLQGDIRKGRMRRYFAIPEEGELPELVVDLFYDQPIPAIVLVDLARVAALKTDQWYALLVHQWAFRSHIDPSDVFIGGLA